MTVSAVRVGAWLWVLALVVLLIAHVVVESAWDPPYSWLHNNISDLGNVHCGAWGDNRRYVCSPRHGWMNAAFVVIGLLLVTGVVLLRRSTGRVAAVLLGFAGLGWVWVGLMPADVNEGLHLLAVLPIFLGGNIALLLTRRRGAMIAGALGLLAMVLHLSGHYAGLGMGGTERVAAFVLPLWAAATGALTLARPRSS